ncbi:hypothetical protein B0H17DRAFT_1206958 [Mycena rosella]|uniref:Uncharacterized protein n=1 Tax=Mycena rosella TaxID=1033263 RepID=A0AAD7D3W1_MYCRO|nr:hypothetical protein B0H17DRAFT_1206958 [Mycena rosella]
MVAHTAPPTGAHTGPVTMVRSASTALPATDAAKSANTVSTPADTTDKPTMDVDIPAAGMTLVEPPHKDIDLVPSPNKYLHSAIDLALLEGSDARAWDNVRSPEAPSPLLDALVRMVVSESTKTTMPQMATITAVRRFFHNIDQEYLSPEDVEATVLLAAERHAQKRKGREGPPAHQVGCSAFLLPIAQEIEDGEVNEDMLLIDSQLDSFFYTAVVCLDLHLNMDIKHPIAENELANHAPPDFDPAQVMRAKANSLGLDLGPVLPDTSTSQLPGNPPRAVVHCPNGPSGVSPSPPKKAHYTDLKLIDTASVCVTCMFPLPLSTLQAPQTQMAAVPSPRPTLPLLLHILRPPTMLTLPNTSLTSPFTYVPSCCTPTALEASPFPSIEARNAATTAPLLATPYTPPVPYISPITAPLTAPGPMPTIMIAPGAAPPLQTFTGCGINPTSGVYRTLDGCTPWLYYTTPLPGGWEEITGMAPTTVLDSVMQAQRNVWSAGIRTNPAAFLRWIGGTTDPIGDIGLLTEVITDFVHAPLGVVQVAAGASVPGQGESPNIFLLTGPPTDMTTALVEEHVISASAISFQILPITPHLSGYMGTTGDLPFPNPAASP